MRSVRYLVSIVKPPTKSGRSVIEITKLNDLRRLLKTDLRSPQFFTDGAKVFEIR